MAANRKYALGRQLKVTATDGGLNSGDPLVLGQKGGVALINQQADGTVSADFQGVYTLTVYGLTNAGANSTVAAGDILYYVAGKPVGQKINKDTTGVRFGYALGAVGAGLNAAIDVLLGY